MSRIKVSRSSTDSRRLAPSGIWLSSLRPSPAQPLPFWRNSRAPAAISAGSGACACAAEPNSNAPVTAMMATDRLRFSALFIGVPTGRPIGSAILEPNRAELNRHFAIGKHWQPPQRQVACATMRSAFALLLGLVCWSSATVAEDLRRATVWDLKLGMPVSAQPASDQCRGFACGSNGGPPRRQLSGWDDFRRCDPEASGLREVYFEYA